jgi:hypothetical protein
MKKLVLFLALFVCVSFAFADTVAPINATTATPGLAVAVAASAPSLLQRIWAAVTSPWAAGLFAFLYATSEALANWFPSLKANSAFQFFIYGITKAEELNPQKTPASS